MGDYRNELSVTLFDNPYVKPKPKYFMIAFGGIKWILYLVASHLKTKVLRRRQRFSLLRLLELIKVKKCFFHGIDRSSVLDISISTV